MEKLTLKFERVSRTLSTKIGAYTADFSFDFEVPTQPTPTMVSFNIYTSDGQPYCSGVYHTNGQFSPTFANVATADWSILATIVAYCNEVINSATDK